MTKIVATQRPWRLPHALSSGALLLALFAPTAADAQLIVVRTLPIADADQFSFFPSLTSGMGGVTIALADSLHDPFVNPATGARLRHPLFFSAPSLFSVSGDAGRGRTLPLGALARTGANFGGVAVAIQSISEGQPLSAVLPSLSLESQSNTDDGSRSNRFGFLMLGHSFAESRLSFAASALWSDVGTIDGTSLLYADSRSVSQAGRATDIRLGMLKEWNGGQSFQALLFNRRMGMTHEVTYGDLYWDPVEHRPVVRDRLELEQDRTSTWGMHFEYVRPLGDSGWRAGVVVTANRLDNPRRPDYEIETVPGSRSRSAAFNIGVGVARSLGATTLAADAIYEPIWSRIWGVSDSAVATAGTTVRAGDKTVDSRLRFSNALLRTGASHDFTLSKDSKLALQLGVQARSTYYSLDQQDLVSGSAREGDRSWMEWTRSWGATLRRALIEFHYRGSKTTGAARPGVNTSSVPPGVVLGAPRPFDIRPPFPAAAASLRDVSVMTHQFSISLRIR